MKTKENNHKEQTKKIAPSVFIVSPQGFLYMKEEQFSSLITTEEREAWLDSLK